MNRRPPRSTPRRRSPATEQFWRDWSGRCKLDGAGDWKEAAVRSLITLEGPNLRPDRRHSRRRHDFAARADRRHAQLGLPLLLASRRDLHPLLPARRGVHRGGRRLARLAAARHRRQRLPDADHVRRGRASGASSSSSFPGSPASRDSAPGPDRKCRRRAIPARCLRRGHGLPLPIAQRRESLRTRGLALATGLVEFLESNLDPSPTKASGKSAAAGSHFTHSKVMAWVAMDRAVKAIEQHRQPKGDLDRWKAVRRPDF